MKESEERLTKLVAVMAQTYRTELTSDQALVYFEWLKEIPGPELDRVFREAMQASPQFMPTGPALLNTWKNRQEQTDTLSADQEWELISAHLGKYGCLCEDLRPALSAAGNYSLRQIGGWEALSIAVEHEPGELRWMAKTFREAYQRHAETGGLKALSRVEARELLGQVPGAVKLLGGRA